MTTPDTALPSPTSKLAVSLDEGTAVATVAVDNPSKRNALDFEMWAALPSVFEALGQDARVRAVVVRGAGESAFASGADIAEFETVRADAAGGRRYEAANEAAFWAVARCPKPVVAQVRGFCLGGGVGLALACDLRIAAEDARFGVPAGRLGVGYPPGAMRMIVAAVGAAAAKRLFFTGERIDAGEALRLGLVQEVVPADALEGTVAALAAGIARNAPLTLRAAKAAINAAAGLTAGAPDPHLAALADACFDSEDYREGRRAFLEKREPRFVGR